MSAGSVHNGNFYAVACSEFRPVNSNRMGNTSIVDYSIQQYISKFISHLNLDKLKVQAGVWTQGPQLERPLIEPLSHQDYKILIMIMYFKVVNSIIKYKKIEIEKKNYLLCG